MMLWFLTKSPGFIAFALISLQRGQTFKSYASVMAVSAFARTDSS